jgi:hypothetical protein
MTEPPDHDLLHEWQSSVKALTRAAGAAAGGDVARQIVAPLRRQAELLQTALDAERRLQRELVGRVLGPVDAAFDLLEESSAALREQAEAIEHAARALEQAAGLMRTQAELLERTIGTMREPSRALESVVGIDRGHP